MENFNNDRSLPQSPELEMGSFEINLDHIDFGTVDNPEELENEVCLVFF